MGQKYFRSFKNKIEMDLREKMKHDLEVYAAQLEIEKMKQKKLEYRH